jgi:hypothetical protein
MAANVAGEKISSKTVNGCHGIRKRGMFDVYQQCAGQTLRRSLAEFDFRHSNRAGGAGAKA